MVEEDSQIEGLVGKKIKSKEEVWNIWTVYSNKEVKKVMRGLLKKLDQADEEVIIIGGDFNARVGEEGIYFNGEAL